MLVLAVLIGCGQAPPDAARVAAPEPDAHAIPMAPVAAPDLVTEAGFKAAHALKADDAGPNPRGRTLTLAESTGYLALPDGPPAGGVVVIHEWWGLNDHIKRWTDRLADAGYAAIAVDLYGGTVAATRDEAMAAMKTVDEAAALAVLAAAHAALGHDDVGASRRAVIGWCFGGGWALRHAIETADLDAAVMYYGRPETDPARLARIQAPVLGIFANDDQGIPPAAVDALEKALQEAGKDVTIRRYDAAHAFANPSGERYAEASAADAWGHVQAFLATHLRGEG